LIVEATEYYVLETLSTHLTDYFNQSELDSARLKEFSREDVADIVFKNRFLDTFSRPMRERAAFVRDSPKTSNHMDRVVAFYGSNGVRYSKFDLVLPIGARIERRSQLQSALKLQVPTRLRDQLYWSKREFATKLSGALFRLHFTL